MSKTGSGKGPLVGHFTCDPELRRRPPFRRDFPWIEVTGGPAPFPECSHESF